MTSPYGVGDLIAQRYKVISQAAGGMAIVFICEDSHTEQKKVALKTPREEFLRKPKAMDDFVEECHLWIGLGYHDHIATAFSVEIIDGRPFLVIEYAGAWTLSSWISTVGLKYPDALGISQKVAAGMAYAQEREPSLVHRDLKPDNILIKSWQGVTFPIDFIEKHQDQIQAAAGTDPDNPDLDAMSKLAGNEIEHRIQNVKVSDFGIARTANGRAEVLDSSQPTSINTRLAGTPRYISPEQCLGDRVDHRSDIYSFGIVLYEMFAGRWPYLPVPDLDRVIRAHVSQEPVPVSRVNSTLRADLAEMIMRCLRKDRSERYQDFHEVLQKLTDLTGELEEDRGLHRIYNLSITPPKGTDIALEQGIALIQMGHVTRGILVLDKLLATVGSGDVRLAILCSGAEALREFGHGNSDVKSLRAALGYCRQALSIDPNRVSALGEMGILLALTGDPESALPVYDRILRINPEEAPMHVNKGTILCDFMGRYEEAIECFDKAIALSPDLIEAYMNRGVALVNLDRFDEAVVAFDHALTLDPQSTNVLLTFGGVLSNRLGKQEEALDMFNRAIRVNSRLARAWHNKGVALRRLGRDDEALDDFRTAISLDRGQANSLFEMGAILMQHGKYAEAATRFRGVMEINHEDPQAFQLYLQCTSLSRER